MQLLAELEPIVEASVNHHLSVAREWFPHQYVPWSAGRDFEGMPDGQPWEPGQSRLSEVARASLVLNLLTEDNLPSYHHEIAATFGRDGAWGTWVHRWTAEEDRHGTAIRDYLLTTRAVDPVALERARMQHMSTGFAFDHHAQPLHTIAYVVFQELATRISHRNTGHYSQDPVCNQLLARIAVDENLHMVFYRSLLRAAFEIAPNETMRAVTDIVKTFQMPGYGMQNFARTSLQIAKAGIYDPRIHHDDVIAPVLRHLGVWHLPGLADDGERAREELAAAVDQQHAIATRFEQRRSPTSH